jgi:NADH-quinone oxidoreductase subunit L
MSLPWYLLLLPLAIAVINHLFLSKQHKIAALTSTASVIATFVISLKLLGSISSQALDWINVGSILLQIGYKIDQLSSGMMIVVTGVGMLVHIFSLAYMKDDASKARYFTNLSLFMFSMTGIVLANNLIMTFIFWELVGLSSYLLIGHWYQKDSAADACKKAFLTNRIGDFGFMIGILFAWNLTGTFAFDQMATGYANSTAQGWLSVTLLCIFCGAIGKSAQLPLHVWLPDAMEGPTPVSALIHAATMVAAGVYMLFRFQLSIGFEHFEGLTASIVIAWTGGITSLVAALMATQQDDIKRILAYSTLSQLGYMIMTIGLCSGEAGMFHLFTHAWFKALLFLGSGAVIYACHHEQNIWKMGGLLKKMPITGITFLLGCMALIAVPYITSGFWSKEEILSAAYHHNKTLFWIAAFVAFLTTFYMTRLFVIAFLGKTRSENADNAHEVGSLMFLPLILLGGMAIFSATKMGGFDIAKSLSAIRPNIEHHDSIILIASISALVLGLILGFTLYYNKEKDSLSIPLLRNRFYIDSFYDHFLVKYFQDAFAAIIHFFDELIINGLLVGGLSRITQSCGLLIRRVQSGNLQTYTVLLGLGILIIIYITVF